VSDVVMHPGTATLGKSISRGRLRRLLSYASLATFICSVGLMTVLSGCTFSSGREEGARKLRVVATTTIVGDVVGRVGGDKIDLDVLMGPGIDPHLYKASEGDVMRIARANVLFYSGLHLEAKMADVFEKISKRIRTVAVTKDLPHDRILFADSEGHTPDPHVWFDVELWSHTVSTVCNALSEADPESSSTFSENARRYREELLELHRYVQEKAQQIPQPQRVLVTAHDAFRYFGRAYGFEVIGLQGISTASEAGTNDIDHLARFLAQRRIRAIFVESSVSPRTVRAVQEAVRARGGEVQIGGQLFSDALGSPGTPEGTYIGTVRWNIDTIVKALAP